MAGAVAFFLPLTAIHPCLPMNFWLRPLGIPLWFILAVALVALLTRRAAAATVNSGRLATSFSAATIPPRLTSISQSSTATIDLGDLTGLTPGRDIEITFQTSDEIVWLGSFDAGNGELSLHFHARFTLTVGSFSTFQDTTWSLGPLEYQSEGTPIAGYSFGPAPAAFTLTVPWGTDLTEVNLTLTDLFSISGNDPLIAGSKLELASAILSTASAVPEPGIPGLGLLSALSLLRRRNPAAPRSRHRAPAA